MKKTYFAPDVQAFAVDQSDVLTITSGDLVKDIGNRDLGVSASDLFQSRNA